MVGTETRSLRLPWFRVHIVLLNDPGRLISVHLMHTGLVAGWAATMLTYELLIYDSTDPVFSPMWRQGCYIMPACTRIGVVKSIYGWSLGIDVSSENYWSYETCLLAHLFLSGLLIIAAFWHWAYWDLELFIASGTRFLVLDLLRVFAIHLLLASILCLGFGLFHISGTFGPGIWTSDSFGLVGSIRSVKPSYYIIGLLGKSYGVIGGHHVFAGFVGLVVALWHISSRPGPLLYKLAGMNNIESVLASSIAAVFFTTFLTAALMWYGSASTPIELNGPTRYQWDNGSISQEIDRRVSKLSSVFYNKSWEQIPDKLVLYDYIGCNPSKGGLFRSGPMLKGDGIIRSYLGHANFELGTLPLSVRRMPAFFETFPVLLVDQGGSLRADIPFRRAESRFSLEEKPVSCYFSGGVLNGYEYSSPSIVKNYARKAQFGEIFSYDKKTVGSDGVFRTSVRGWFSFAHVTLALLFFLGHLWHAARALFKDIWTGVSFVEMTTNSGRNEKLGDKSSASRPIEV